MSSAQPEATIDCALAFANCLMLFGSARTTLDAQHVVIADSRGSSARQPATHFKMFAHKDGVSLLQMFRGGDSFGFVAVLDLRDLMTLRIFDGAVAFSIETAGELVKGTLPVALAPLQEDGDGSALAYLQLAASLDIIDRRLVDFIGRRGGADTASPMPGHAIDIAGRSHCGFIVEGWIANGRSSNLSFLSEDGLVHIAGSEIIYKARPDVSKHLRAQRLPVSTEDHGVLLNFPHTLATTDSFIVLEDRANSLVPLARIKLNFSENRDRLLELVSYAVGGGKLPRPAQARRFYLPFFAEAKNAEEFCVNWIKPAHRDVTTSIIVPLFREYRFIFSLLTMQLAFSGKYEWLFVSDDPVQHQLLTRILERRSNALRCPTALITNRFNYGYGAANNIGASVARGKTLLFMNSDIWVDSVRSIDQATRKMQEGGYQIAGFRLLYEDGTIQHDGITFRPSGLMHNLLLADHPGKGTPHDGAAGEMTEVPAVTGAMLMIDKDDFLRVGQFDRAYIKGDFEDADLCLKVRAQGGKVGLYKSNDIYHLERQSIRLMGEDASRLALTYLNCITFNERWNRYLTQPQASRRGQTEKLAELRPRKARAG